MKIKCPFCGRSYVYYQYKTTSNEYWAHWKKVGICSGSEKINQEELKRVCAKVLNIEKFNKEVFLKNVDYISVPKRDILEFHFKNGEIITERYRP